MNVAPMSRQTIRAYPRLYHKKLRKTELVTERVKENDNLQITLTLSVTVITVLDHHPKFQF